MATILPLSPSFVSLAATNVSSSDSDDIPLSPKVRFDHECVLIPDPVPISRIPRFVTKSYSLPLWKRKRDPSLVSDTEDDALEDHVVFKVPVPRITTKARSPSRDHIMHQPLVSCLVQSSPSSSPSSSTIRTGRPRRASLPAPIQSDAVTVPLRTCCTQCYPSIDKCMKEGEHWEVRFSRGALRRRKSVSDAPAPARSRHRLRDTMPGFDTIVAVDEIEQRRKSTDIDDLTSFAIEMSAAVSPLDTSLGPEEIPLRRVLSHSDVVYPNPGRSLPDLHPLNLSPPILEEDEHRPSPRRTPVSSPLGSSTNLPSTCNIHPIHTAIVDKLSTSTSPITRASPGEFTLNLDSVFPSPINLTTPAPPPSKVSPTSYFSVPHTEQGHQRAFSDSPASSPSSSPRIPHPRSPSMDLPVKRSFMHLPGGILRASTSVLKGISGIGGMPMSA